MKGRARRPQSKAPHPLAWLNIEWIRKYEWTRAVGRESFLIARYEDLSNNSTRTGLLLVALPPYPSRFTALSPLTPYSSPLTPHLLRPRGAVQN
jgi:hypothetical protein